MQVSQACVKHMDGKRIGSISCPGRSPCNCKPSSIKADDIVDPTHWEREDSMPDQITPGGNENDTLSFAVKDGNIPRWNYINQGQSADIPNVGFQTIESPKMLSSGAVCHHLPCTDICHCHHPARTNRDIDRHVHWMGGLQESLVLKCPSALRSALG